MPSLKVLFYLVHPAHFHLFKNVIKTLAEKGVEPYIVIRPKESLEALCQKEGLPYLSVSDGNRKNTKTSMLRDIIIRDLKAYKIIKRIRPDLLIGSSVEISHVGKLLGIPSVITHEDDYDNMRYFSYSAFPFATNILSPIGCRQGKWEKKSIFYPGYHELAYLHPDHYTPDPAIKKKLDADDYFLLRFSQFTAHHDFGASGISDSLANEIVELLKPHGKVFISSERPLNTALEKFRIKIHPSDLHDVLAFSKMLIGDSQSMAMEASVLGVPSLRFNKFAENYSINVLDELEQKYKLTIGINSNNPEKLISTLHALLNDPNTETIWKKRQQTLLKEKINTADYLIDFILNYSNRKR